MIGLFLVLIGFVWLLGNLGIITTTVSQIIWPVIIIALGLTLLLKKGRYMGHWCCGHEHKDRE